MKEMTQEEYEQIDPATGLPIAFNVGLDFGYYKDIYIPHLVRQILLYGSTRFVEVVATHNLTAEDVEYITELPLFKKETRELKAIAEASPNALIQIKAREIVDEGLESLRNIVKYGSDKDKIAAMKFLAQIGGATETGGLNRGVEEGNTRQASGLTLNVNLGANGSLIPPMPNTTRPLRKLNELKEVIDITPTNG